ncbi:MAG TPA: kelch repeat-containing protein [Terriglobales bacterium]|nr:kelch repeat-containing protein [Terriglobales bacterium]
MFRLVFAVVLTTFVIGCGGGGSTTAPQEPVAISISPSSATMLVSASARFSATVSGTSYTGISYSVIEANGGSVAPDGSYVAPSTPGIYHVRVTSDADPTRHAEAVVNVHDYKNEISRLPNASDAYDYHTATLLEDGSVLIVGGVGFNGVHKQTDRYLPQERRFVPGPSLTTARMQHGATLLPNGKLLVTGGYDLSAPGTQFDPVFKSTEIYDPATAKFTVGPEMWFPRRYHVATLLKDGRVLITGGIQLRGTGFGASGNTEIYDPATNQFVLGQRLVESGRWLHTATLLPDGRVLIAGGRSNNCSASCEIFSLNTAEIFDPATGMFSPTGSLSIGRFGHSATLLPDGRVMILGGTTTEEIGPSQQVQTAEVYDPGTGKFHFLGYTALGRGLHALTLLNNGRYLLVGGYNQNDSPTGTTECFDTVTRASAPGPDMNDWRIRATAVRLNSGEVLIVGGNNSGGPVVPVDLIE